MRHPRTPARRRVGFTLIELLVVMAIIAVLVSLISSAVFYAYQRLAEVQCRNEITGLATGVAEFEKDNGRLSLPPPSRLYLDESGAYVPAANYTGFKGLSAAQQAAVTQLATDSKAYLTKVWPRMQAQVDWNGNGKIDAPYVLEGEQCLVFFLGGARDASGLFIGFSADPANPMNPNPAIKRKGPYFQFVMARVAAGPGSGLPIYYDTYSSSPLKKGDQPYAYFSSGKAPNGYNAYVALGFDCASLTTPGAKGPVPIQPYYQGSANQPQYYEADTYQIISAGKNQTFGPGGLWVAASATSIGAAGADDFTNFASRKMGVQQ